MKATATDHPVAQRHLVRLAQATQLYPVSRNTLRRRIADGTLTAYRFGAKIIAVDVAELDALFQPVKSADLSTWGGS